jgi:hypothetical protein
VNDQEKKIIYDLYRYIKKRLGFEKDISKICFIKEKKNSQNPFAKTAHYNPSDMGVTIYISNRHFKDILRSFSHEMIHHYQNCLGNFDNIKGTEPGYAQNDPFLRKMESEAYLLGNLLLRDFEDNIKKNISCKKANYTLEEVKKVTQMNEDKKQAETIVKKETSEPSIKSKEEEKDFSPRGMKLEQLGKELMRRWGYDNK